ncbi:three-Cys-motif partner protein TcmP [Methylopila sp. M107]|uniref:three-Cys-motif partner protein TcmP n=1 Tax=Methylopila sp. M107 TaxID=1101190 RepID=UPI0009DBE21F|nr:three-Cys-motif partner protein TcmP [Methylopila sp. M107]
MRRKSGSKNEFGGPWTEIKLDAIEYYLQCYLNAMTRTPFNLWYIDAFAGTGRRLRKRTIGGLEQNRIIETIEEEVEGSVLRALKLQPPFHHFVFIEKDPDFHAALENAVGQPVSAKVECLKGETNLVLRREFSQDEWQGRRAARRGVVFLDPFALQVEWKTLEVLASTKALDVWYLFPLRDVTRQLAKSYNGIGPKAPKLDSVLGPAWSTDLYAFPLKEAPVQTELFDLGDTEQFAERVGDQSHIERWFKTRLELIFAHVSEPLPLFTDPSRQAFSLFLAISNPDRSAIDLATKFSGYVSKNFAPAFRHKFSR